MDEKTPCYHYDAATGDDMVRVLNELQDRYLRGELRCVALRVFNKDGTWEDVALGGTPEEQAEALENLQQMHRRSH
jgi:hypothetical protein